jgi:excinuclease UvrABC nuclease subunit
MTQTSESIKPRIKEILHGKPIYTLENLKEALNTVELSPKFTEYFNTLLKEDKSTPVLFLQSLCYGYMEEQATQQALKEYTGLFKDQFK